jgi:hypothetical protein
MAFASDEGALALFRRETEAAIEEGDEIVL